MIRGFDAIIAQNSTASHTIEPNTVANKQPSKVARQSDDLVRELFDSLPDNIDGCTVGDMAVRYRELRDFERRLDATMTRKRLDIVDSVNRSVKVGFINRNVGVLSAKDL